MRPIIEARGISKMYQIGSKSERYLSLRDSLSSPRRWFSSAPSETFFALRDISFDIFPGESVGIIGKNGAGKSTLLKILSRITPPTSGTVKLRGRVASLLEVGTGFHPELTGRENIFFNGSILGMRKAEIQSKFDEIVDFSGVEQFLDTPLKQYSSGMQLRLAFAVAAYLDPEILLIDEILSVGDADFQKKCLGKMEAVSKGEGRTVVVVSHDLGMIDRLTSKSIFLENNKITKFDSTPTVLEIYQKKTISKKNYAHSTSNTTNKIIEIFFPNNSNIFQIYENIRLVVKLNIDKSCADLCFAYAVQDLNNKRVTFDFIKLNASDKTVNLEIIINSYFLNEGSYFLDFSVIQPNIYTHDLQYNALSFTIIDNNSQNTLFKNVEKGSVFSHDTIKQI